MRALVKYETGPGHVEIREVDPPVLTPGHVLIDIAYAAVCGTDRLAVEGSHDFGVARTLGHEASGVIAAVADDVVDRPDLVVGARVTVETDAYLCMRCEYCRKEEFNRCPYRKGIGTTTDGALADQLVMPERAVHVLPDGIDLVEGALTEPLAIAVHAVVEQSPSLAGQVVVVVGPGAIGQLCAQVAHAVGATVVLVGRTRHAEALQRAKDAGIPHVVDAETEDLDAIVAGLTGGYGAHSVFECSGASGVVESSIPLLRRGGRLVLVAFFREDPHVDIDAVINREIEVVGSRGKRPSSYRTALRLMESRQVDLSPLSPLHLPLEQWQEGLAAVAAGRKVIFTLRP
ncbi:sorbitol dehydrogenase [Cnuibacter physcomitrellae]|nr:zinc-binding dehydrogenase [Cnuibacter physcomitrellae]GGI36448.1 sorbitol dehydrogenase [Cnuibacter physcomitrellae]